MDKEKNKKNIFEKGDDFLELFQKGKKFTESLLKENERLRLKIIELERNMNIPRSNDNMSEDMNKQVKELETQIDKLKNKIARVEAENTDFAKKYVEIEEENNKLANLYVASYHLHSSLEQEEIIKTIGEIVINLIGANRYAIYVMGNEKDVLVPALCEGMDLEELSPVKRGIGKEGEIAASGDMYFVPNTIEPKRNPDEPIAIIPLVMKSQLVGLITIYHLFRQKTGLTHIDFELFSLLASHAASALFSAHLYSLSKRKLSTMEGLFDLLKDTQV